MRLLNLDRVDRLRIFLETGNLSLAFTQLVLRSLPTLPPKSVDICQKIFLSRSHQLSGSELIPPPREEGISPSSNHLGLFLLARPTPMCLPHLHQTSRTAPLHLMALHNFKSHLCVACATFNQLEVCLLRVQRGRRPLLRPLRTYGRHDPYHLRYLRRARRVPCMAQQAPRSSPPSPAPEDEQPMIAEFGWFWQHTTTRSRKGIRSYPITLFTAPVWFLLSLPAAIVALDAPRRPGYVFLSHVVF